MTPEQMKVVLLDEARACIGTPWHHQGRVKGVGMDCIGLFVHCAKVAGCDFVDQITYKKLADEQRLLDALNSNGAIRIEVADIQPADLVFFRLFGRMQHAGIISDIHPKRFIHIYNVGPALCAEADLESDWESRIHSFWRYKEFA